MVTVLLTALGVGGATLIGSLIGFLFKNPSQKFNDIILSFAAGVMLAAAIIGLIIPSFDYHGNWAILIVCGGIIVGAIILNLIDTFSYLNCLIYNKNFHISLYALYATFSL